MLRRAAFLAVALAPAFPVVCLAQATPDRAASLQQQIQDWLQTTVGSAVTIARSPVQVTAAGDHYDVALPLGTRPDAPSLTGKMTDAGGGRWTVDDVRLPSPSVFHFQLPPSAKPGAPTGEVTTTLTIGEQNQRLLFDPTFVTPSTSTSAIKDLSVTTTGPTLTQLSHVDSAIGASTMTPTSDGRVDIATNSSFDGYTIKMAPEQNADPVSLSMGNASLVMTMLGVSRDRSVELIRILSKISAASAPNQAAAMKPLDRDTSMALVAALADLATGLSLDEKVTDVAVTTHGMSGTLKLFSFGLASKANSGKLEAQLPLSAEGLTLPDLGLGSTAKLIPTKLALTPTISSVPTSALMQMARKLADKQDPDSSDVATLFSQGPITAGIDNFLLDVAGSSFTGGIKLLASAPNVFSATGQITADNIDRLQQAISADPQTAQVTPLLIFLKGVGRAEQNRLVWDIVYRDGHVLVNGQDMTALAGAGSAASSDAPARARPSPPAGSASRPPQRAMPKP